MPALAHGLSDLWEDFGMQYLQQQQALDQQEQQEQQEHRNQRRSRYTAELTPQPHVMLYSYADANERVCILQELRPDFVVMVDVSALHSTQTSPTFAK